MPTKKHVFYCYNLDSPKACKKALALLAGHTVLMYTVLEHFRHVLSKTKPDLLLIRIRSNIGIEYPELIQLMDLLAASQFPFVISVCDTLFEGINQRWPDLMKNGYRVRSLDEFQTYLVESRYLEHEAVAA
jgi:hypothetical protein